MNPPAAKHAKKAQAPKAPPAILAAPVPSVYSRLHASYEALRNVSTKRGEALPHFFELPNLPEIQEEALIPLSVPFALNPDQISVFTSNGMYPFWIAGSRNDDKGHPLIGAGRSLAEHFMTKWVIGEARSLQTKLRVVDVGSNVERLRASFRMNGWSTSDCDTHHMIPDIQFGDSERQKAGNKYRHCVHTLEKCDCSFVKSSDILIFQHSLYYFSPSALLSMLTGGRRAIGSVHHMFDVSGSFYGKQNAEMRWHVSTDGHVKALARGNLNPYIHPPNSWMQMKHYTAGGRTLFWRKLWQGFESYVYEFWAEEHVVPDEIPVSWWDPAYSGQMDKNWVQRMFEVNSAIVQSNSVGPSVDSSSTAYVVQVTGITMRYGSALILHKNSEIIALPAALLGTLVAMCAGKQRDGVMRLTLMHTARRYLTNGSYPEQHLGRACILVTCAAMAWDLEEETARQATYNKRYAKLVDLNNQVRTGKQLQSYRWYTPITRFFAGPFAACTTDEHEKADARDVGLKIRPPPMVFPGHDLWPKPVQTDNGTPSAPPPSSAPPPELPPVDDDNSDSDIFDINSLFDYYSSFPPLDSSSGSPPLAPDPSTTSAGETTSNNPFDLPQAALKITLQPWPNDLGSTPPLLSSGPATARFSTQSQRRHSYPGFDETGSVDLVGGNFPISDGSKESKPLLAPNPYDLQWAAYCDSMALRGLDPYNDKILDEEEDDLESGAAFVCPTCGGMRCTCKLLAKTDVKLTETSFRQIYSMGIDPATPAPTILGSEPFLPVAVHKSNVPPEQKPDAKINRIVDTRTRPAPQPTLSLSLIGLGKTPTCVTTTDEDFVRGFKTRVGRQTATPLGPAWGVIESKIAAADGILSRLRPPAYEVTIEKQTAWIETQPPNMRAEYTKALESLSDKPLETQDCHCKVFIKAERSAHLDDLGEAKADPRLITSFSPRRQVSTGPFHKFYAKHLRKEFDVKVGNPAIWVNGSRGSADGFGKWFDSAKKSFGKRKYKVKWGDQTKFEAHRNSEAWSTNVKIQQDACKDVNFLKALNETKNLVGYGTSHPFKMKVPYVLTSGATETSVDNALRNIEAAVYVFGEFVWGECMYAFNGDDWVCLILDERDITDDVFHRGMGELGFECTVLTSENTWDCEFCQLLPYPTKSGTVWGPKIGRVLSRLPWKLSTSRDDPRGVALGMLASCWHVPFIREYLVHVEKLSSGITPVAYLHRPTTKRKYLNDENTWRFINHRYGLGPDDLDEFVTLIRSCRLGEHCSWLPIAELVNKDA